MKNVLTHCLRCGVASAILVCLSTSTAWAQKPSKPPGDDSVTMQWTIAIGLMVVIGVSAFLNPKRSHLN